MTSVHIAAFPQEEVYIITWVNTSTYEAMPVFRTVIIKAVEIIDKRTVHYIGDDGITYTNKCRIFKDKEHAKKVYQELFDERRKINNEN